MIIHNPLLEIFRWNQLETDEIISKQKESFENNYGEEGRTQYIIEKLLKNQQLPNSDYLYIDRMVKLCETEIIEPEQVIENILSEDFIKCNYCDIKINLEDKSVRKNNFWFHDTCFGKIPTPKPEK